MGRTFGKRDSVTCTTHSKITRQLLVKKLSQSQSQMTFDMTKDSRQPTKTAQHNVLHRLDKLIDRAQTRIYWSSVEQEKDIYKTEDKYASLSATS
jgi:hypothetical protein